VQHNGFGKKLLKKAEDIAFWNGMKGTVVISGIGVREYYEKRGYHYENNFMVKHFNIYKYSEVFIGYILTVVACFIIIICNN
jgi:hypothetical protein